LIIPTAPAWLSGDARLSSNHSGGVVATFVDGHSTFLSENVDQRLYKLLCTPAGKKCMMSQTEVLLESELKK
jgi:prepilin-type processing-associated H-X9-DG protein